MKAYIAVLLVSLAVCCVPGRAQSAQKTRREKVHPKDIQPPSATLRGGPKNDSRSLTWVKSDVNPKTVFWIQGRFIPVGDADYQGNADVVTILCTIRERECLEIDSTSPFAHSEQAWIDEYKAVNWEKSGILATGRSLDGCTDETLKIHFAPPSVVIVNSPVLPMSENCRKFNGITDKIAGKRGFTIKGQMEQDELVPTRAIFPWADLDLESGKAHTPAQNHAVPKQNSH